MASVPHKVTSAIEYATSSSLASANGSTAAMAEAPQMLYPVAISRPIARLSPSRRASHCVPKKVAVTTAMTAISVFGPSLPSSVSERRKPSSTMPARSTFLAQNFKPGLNAFSMRPNVAPRMPNETATTCGETISTFWWTT